MTSFWETNPEQRIDAKLNWCQSLQRELMPISARISYHVIYMITTCCGVYFATTSLPHKNHSTIFCQSIQTNIICRNGLSHIVTTQLKKKMILLMAKYIIMAKLMTQDKLNYVIFLLWEDRWGIVHKWEEGKTWKLDKILKVR